MSTHKITTTAAIDYETYFDKECTLKKLSNWSYTHHPLFEAYLLSVVTTDDFEWVGSPKDFDWSRLEGARVIAHNAGFELAVTEFLRELGVVPANFRWAEMQDTADMAAFLHSPRSLEQSALSLLGLRVDKGPIAKMSGKRWADTLPELRAEIEKYCLNDSRTELRLWVEHNEKWPENERILSAATREMCWAGLPIDVPGTKAAIAKLTRNLAKVRKEIPWPDPPLSPNNVKKECAKHGIKPPATMEKDSAVFDLWLEAHGEKFPWARAMGVYRSMNAHLKKLITMRDRTDASGIFRYGMKYFGGHLGRDSGDAGFNPQNMPRKTMHGVYLRNLAIKAPPGKILGIVDEAQIEPRVLTWLARDEERLEMMRKGMDVYEIAARTGHGYTDTRSLKEVNPDMRQHMKVEVLACGYGAGPPKVKFIAKKEAGLDLSLEETEQLVFKFRSRKFIPNFWKRLEMDMLRSKGENYEMELPSGRIVLYRDVKNLGGLTAEIVRHGRFVRWPWWGGSLAENATQALARDIYMFHVLKIREAGYQILLRAHDEVVTLLDLETAEQDLLAQLAIMRTPPPWIEDFPAAADGALSPIYKKI
jgi:hypothetical protein